jgi:hypothetical protein
MKKWIERANNERTYAIASGRFLCMSPWDEEANGFLHVAWKGINWSKWLNGRMAKRMDNERFPTNFPMGWRGKCILMWHEKTLISWNGWMGRWPIKDSPCIFPWNEEANAFHVTWKGIDWLGWLNGRMANRTWVCPITFFLGARLFSSLLPGPIGVALGLHTPPFGGFKQH